MRAQRRVERKEGVAGRRVPRRWWRREDGGLRRGEGLKGGGKRGLRRAAGGRGLPRKRWAADGVAAGDLTGWWRGEGERRRQKRRRVLGNGRRMVGEEDSEKKKEKKRVGIVEKKKTKKMKKVGIGEEEELKEEEQDGGPRGRWKG